MHEVWVIDSGNFIGIFRIVLPLAVNLEDVMTHRFRIPQLLSSRQSFVHSSFLAFNDAYLHFTLRTKNIMF